MAGPEAPVGCHGGQLVDSGVRGLVAGPEVGVEAREFVGYDVVGVCEDVGQRWVKFGGESGELIGARCGELALLDAHEGAVVEAATLGEATDRRALGFSARSVPWLR